MGSIVVPEGKKELRSLFVCYFLNKLFNDCNIEPHECQVPGNSISSGTSYSFEDCAKMRCWPG